MAKRLLNQNNFNAGELSPRLYARSDVGKYNNALETATNCKVMPHGPAERRTGSQYIADTKTAANAVELIPFQFSQGDALIIEVGNLYMRFYANSAQVLDGGSPVELVTPWTTAQIPNLSYVQFGDKLYVAHPSHEPRVITRASNTSWSIETLSASPEPTYEAGEEPATTLTPAATTGVGITLTAGSAVFLDGDIGRQIINNSDGETGRASITALGGAAPNATVTVDIIEDFTDTNAIASGDWKLDLSPIADLTPDTTKGGSIVNITADLPSSTTASDTFRTTDVGKYILIHGGVVQIVTRNSGSDVDCEVLKSLTDITETAVWTLETPTWDATRGYPRAVGLMQERLVFGGTTAQPQTLWFSETGIFDGFGVGSADDDSIQVDLSSSQVNQIEWMATGRDFIVGTSGSESTISATSGPITPSNIEQVPRTYFGSNQQTPLTVGNEVLFHQSTDRKVRSFRYDFNIDGYAGEDLTFLSEHITAGSIKEIAYAQEPDSQIYVVLDDGDMVVGTYRRDQQVIGWTKFTSTGSYENVQTITVGDVDQVWVVVKYTIDGATARYVELFDTGDGTDDLHGFSDSFLTYSDPKAVSAITKANPVVVTTATHGYSNGDTVKLVDVGGMTEINNRSGTVANKTATTFELTEIDSTAFTTYTSGGEAHKKVTTVSGLDHLEGETVQVKGDGAAQPDKTVASGAITLATSAAEVVVGLEYATTIKTLRKEFDIGMGSMQGQRSRWARPIIRVYKSAKPLLNGEFLPARSGADEMDEKVPLFTGDLEYGPLDWGNNAQLTITLSDPFPLQVQGVFGAVDGGSK